MAKKPVNSLDPNQALAKLDEPRMQWKVILQIAGALGVLWITAWMTVPYIGYWGIGVVGAITVVAFGFAIYVARLAKKSRAIVQILKQASDAPGRKAALEQLAAGDSTDAMNALARAQLLASEKPQEAVAILEQVNMAKAPAVAQDDVRANLALLYLSLNRAREARGLADQIRLDRQSNPKSKAMYAAVVAESFARTGKPDAAKKLLETYSAEDPAYGEVSALLRRAQVYTFMATKNRGLAKRAMTELVSVDPNLLGTFVQKGAPTELMKMAREVLAGSGFTPKMQYKARMR